MNREPIPIFLIFLLILFFPLFSPGEDRSKLSLQGFLAYEHFSFFSDNEQAIDMRNELRFNPGLTFRPFKNMEAVATAEFRQDFSDNSRSDIFFKEAYIDMGWSKGNLRIGRQLISWGRADTIRPTNQFKRLDNRDIIEDRDIGILAIKGAYYLSDDYTLEGVWAPIFEKNTLSYDTSNRWFLLPREGNLPGYPGLFQFNYQVNQEQEPPRKLSASQLGLRLDGHHRAWDFAFMYAFNYDRTPTFIDRQILSVDPFTNKLLIELIPVYKRIHVFGADWSTAFSGYGLRGELTYTLTEDKDGINPLIDDPYFHFIVGIDRNFKDLIKSWDLFIILQYTLDTEFPRHGKTNQEERGISLKHFYEHAILLNAQLKFSQYNQFNKLTLKAFVNLEEGDYLISPELSWRPVQGVILTLGMDILGGGKDTFFGQFRSNDRIRISSKYEF